MPHIIVKLASGKSDVEKLALAEQISKVVVTALDTEEKFASVTINDVQLSDWTE